MHNRHGITRQVLRNYFKTKGVAGKRIITVNPGVVILNGDKGPSETFFGILAGKTLKKNIQALLTAIEALPIMSFRERFDFERRFHSAMSSLRAFDASINFSFGSLSASSIAKNISRSRFESLRK